MIKEFLNGFIDHLNNSLYEEGEITGTPIANTTQNLPDVPVISPDNLYKRKNARLGKIIRRKKPL